MIPDNARSPRITAAAGTELAGASSDGTVLIPAFHSGILSSHLTGLYTPKSFFTHAALLRQGCPHCAIFLTAASRRSLGRISVPVWLIILSDQLPIVGSVGRYPTNYLMGRGLILSRRNCACLPAMMPSQNICGISPPFGGLSLDLRQITHALLTRPPVYSPALTLCTISCTK